MTGHRSQHGTVSCNSAGTPCRLPATALTFAAQQHFRQSDWIIVNAQPDAAKSLLIYPPITDPTSPYHSLTYLDSYARSRGYPAADIVDINVEAFHHSYTPGAAAWLEAELAAVRAGAGRGRADSELMRAGLLPVGDPDATAVRSAVEALQDPDRFYDYNHYQQAVDQVQAWMNCLGATGFPGQFRAGFRLAPLSRFLHGPAATMTDRQGLERVNRPFKPYYEEVLLPRARAGGYGVVGINITYAWQLPFALWIGRLVRRCLPRAFVIAGGTEVASIWKYSLDRTTYATLFDDFDATVVGEGEAAYVAILESRRHGGLPEGEPNIHLHPKYGTRRMLPVRYENLGDIPVPDFSGIEWRQYLSPEPFVYYSPTRGCYWNKCTFCDYGLNSDGPTSPWRQSQEERMIEDVRAISAHSRFIYFSVDVLAPATILRFAERAVEERLDIRWGAEIRLEKYWSRERCELLRRSGCVAVSVGFESGNQRILDLINKGTTPAQVKQTIQAMHAADIGVQMMGFTGFPTETFKEARDSIDFLVDNRELWTFGGLGDFLLTAGSIVAKDPARFGISNVRPETNEGVARSLDYDEPVSQAAREAIKREKRRVRSSHYERPWLGGTDTPHSFFYLDRFRSRTWPLLRDNDRLDPGDEDRPFQLNGTLIPNPGAEVLGAYDAIYGDGNQTPDETRAVFRRADGRILLLPSGLARLLGIFAEPVTLAKATERLWMLDSASAHKAWDLLIRCAAIRRVAGDAPAPTRTSAAVTAGS
jgi:anaerobic magnesium-protoporphyrin IX monomethyl ester cyclase